MSGQMKVLLDRTYPCCQTIRLKKAVLIAVSAAGGESVFDAVVAGFEEYMKCLPQTDDMGYVLAAGVCTPGTVLEEKLEEAERMGREI